MAEKEQIKKLADEQSLKLVKETWENHVTNTSLFRQKLVERYKQYRGISVRKSYDGLANVFVNETLQAVESIVAQIFNLLFSESRFFYLRGKEETDEKDAVITENLEMSAIEAMSFKSKMLSAIRQFVIYGTVVVRVFWKTKEKKVFARNELEDGTFVVEEENKLVYDNPDVQVIDLLDIALEVGKSSISDMNRIVIRKMVDWDYIKDRQKNLVYGGDIDGLKKAGGGKNSGNDSNYKDQKMRSIGINVQNVSESNDYEVLEMYGKIPVWWIYEKMDMNSKEAEDMVDGVIEIIDRKQVVRRQRNPFYHQEIPVTIAQFIKIDNEAYGIGAVEICEHLQAELNDKRNQLLDHASLSILPPLVKQRGANIKNENIKLKPHHIIPSDLPGDSALSPLRIGGNPQEIIAMDSIIKQDIRNEVGASNPQQGIKSGGESTAYEMSVLQQKSSSRVNIYALEFAENILKFCYKMIYMLLYQYMSKQRAIKIVGKDGVKWHKRKPEDLIMDMDFVPKVPTDMDSRIIVRNQLIQFLTAIAKYYPQVNAYNLVRRIYMLFGEDDVDEIVPKPDSERGQGDLSFEEEMLVLSLGQRIDAKYYEDHTSKIDYAINWLRGNSQNLSEEGKEAFENYIQQHTQYLKVLETAQAAIGNLGGSRGQSVQPPSKVKPPAQQFSEQQSAATRA